MDSEVLIAMISGLCVAVPSVIATIYSNRKTSTVHEMKLDRLNEKVDSLEEKVEKHNNLIERMAVAENDIKTLYKKVDKKGADKND